MGQQTFSSEVTLCLGSHFLTVHSEQVKLQSSRSGLGDFWTITHEGEGHCTIQNQQSKKYLSFDSDLEVHLDQHQSPETLWFVIPTGAHYLFKSSNHDHFLSLQAVRNSEQRLVFYPTMISSSKIDKDQSYVSIGLCERNTSFDRLFPKIQSLARKHSKKLKKESLQKPVGKKSKRASLRHLRGRRPKAKWQFNVNDPSGPPYKFELVPQEEQQQDKQGENIDQVKELEQKQAEIKQQAEIEQINNDITKAEKKEKKHHKKQKKPRFGWTKKIGNIFKKKGKGSKSQANSSQQTSSEEAQSEAQSQVAQSVAQSVQAASVAQSQQADTPITQDFGTQVENTMLTFKGEDSLSLSSRNCELSDRISRVQKENELQRQLIEMQEEIIVQQGVNGRQQTEDKKKKNKKQGGGRKQWSQILRINRKKKPQQAESKNIDKEEQQFYQKKLQQDTIETSADMLDVPTRTHTKESFMKHSEQSSSMHMITTKVSLDQDTGKFGEKDTQRVQTPLFNLANLESDDDELEEQDPFFKIPQRPRFVSKKRKSQRDRKMRGQPSQTPRKNHSNNQSVIQSHSSVTDQSFAIEWQLEHTVSMPHRSSLSQKSNNMYNSSNNQFQPLTPTMGRYQNKNSQLFNVLASFNSQLSYYDPNNMQELYMQLEDLSKMQEY